MNFLPLIFCLLSLALCSFVSALAERGPNPDPQPVVATSRALSL